MVRSLQVWDAVGLHGLLETHQQDCFSPSFTFLSFVTTNVGVRGSGGEFYMTIKAPCVWCILCI